MVGQTRRCIEMAAHIHCNVQTYPLFIPTMNNYVNKIKSPVEKRNTQMEGEPNFLENSSLQCMKVKRTYLISSKKFFNNRYSRCWYVAG